jgi:hypothetical protein
MKIKPTQFLKQRFLGGAMEIFKYIYKPTQHEIVFMNCDFKGSFRTGNKDAWHTASGYRSGQNLQCITYHKDHGEIARNLVNITQIS